MKFISEGIKNGIIADKYGKRGKEFRFGMPTLSFPFEIIDAPKGTKSFAIIFEDPDSQPFCGKIWVHWLIANLHRTSLGENESKTSNDFIQGTNTWNENCYGGPCPSDKPHKYKISVFALSENLRLFGNFSKTQLENEMKNKIIDTTVVYGVYSN
ncbi:MAG: YbhB/YbcL family Raf kinase inhibitor-like protein [Clostridia bacterium]|nr:YbhB/YbcL family Raf kinase inhibitor-like protein [Clostridia bacterium]